MVKYLLYTLVLVTFIILVIYLSPKYTNLEIAGKYQNGSGVNTNNKDPTPQLKQQTENKNLPTPFSDNTGPRNIKQEPLKTLKNYNPPDINYGDWLTYVNNTHKYSLKYPKDWTIDYSQANNFEDYQDTECCNVSRLVIYKDSTKWELLLNVLYTGGRGWSPEDFDECYQNQDNVCVESVEGPMNVFGLDLYKKTITVKTTGKVLFTGLGEINDISTDVKPVFNLTKGQEKPIPKYGSINYTGKSISDYIKILDGITLSINNLK